MADLRVAADELRSVVTAVFSREGLSHDDAAIMADALVWAEARGVGSHGLAKVPRYLELLRSGAARAMPQLRFGASHGGMLNCDADRALGPVALSAAVDRACGLAETQGVVWVSVVNTLHTGAIGHFGEQAALRGKIAIVVVGGMPAMSYTGAAGKGVATSPIAIAVPSASYGVILLDMATATIALGRIAVHRKSGQPLPHGSAEDDAGEPTTDPHRATMPTPLGGPKGAGLSLMIELLTGVLAGAPILGPFHHRREGGRKHRQNAAVIVADIAAWGDPAEFLSRVDDCVAGLQSLPPRPGAEILLPGERGARARATAEAEGIAVDPAGWAALRLAAGL